MKTGLLALAAVAAVWLTGALAAAAATPVITDVKLDAAEAMTVGDHIILTVRIEADAGTTVEFVRSSLEPHLTLASTPRSSSRQIEGGRIETTIKLELAVFLPGAVPLPPMTVSYRTASGESGQLQTPALELAVQSVLPASGAITPRELKPQAEIGRPPLVWPLYALLGLTLALVVSAGLLAARLRHTPQPLPQVIETLESGPEDRARDALDGLQPRLLNQEYASYYTLLAETVRGYLSERYGFPAFALTTRELQASMQRAGIERWQARLVSGLLSQCDSVVYARYRPEPERADADLTAAYEIIELSRPVREANQAPVS